ncbi:MAG: 50S ribosomal protein L10 [Deltaproteobacteria bacterium]|nr:50S ribosomal protein L10 [Deltaproteobacteria bacterium]MBW1939835.1 50S ribosomal protein L10 [Deltaproteobacteria bacterium]MBW2010116.1 50S ribosomal protein L10 [Deltaproteobacteria bacterium]MBW2099790.1 50S ribosomal protein L10 [Deltaproteobacteria bacterium]
MNLTEKKNIVEQLHDNLSRSTTVILSDYKGLDVSIINDLRRKLRESDVEFKVVKNTLLGIASQDTDVSLIKDYFKGPNAIALSFDDPVAPAKILSEFAEKHEKLEIKVGVMNGKVLDLSAIKALSSLPSREVLLAQVLSAMNGVPTAFVRALSNVPERLLNVLQAIKDKKEAA